MTLFDYVVVFILAASVLLSLLRGLVREILSLAGWLVAFIVANAYGAALAPLLPAVIPGEAPRMMIAFVALFIGVRILMGLFSKVVAALVSATGLGLVDRGLGSLFGLGRGLVIVLAAVILCSMTALPQQAFWKQAQLSGAAEQGARLVKPFLPDAFARQIQL